MGLEEIRLKFTATRIAPASFSFLRPYVADTGFLSPLKKGGRPAGLSDDTARDSLFVILLDKHPALIIWFNENRADEYCPDGKAVKFRHSPATVIA